MLDAGLRLFNNFSTVDEMILTARTRVALIEVTLRPPS